VRDRIASGGMIVVVGLILILTFAGNAAVAFLTSRIAGSTLAHSVVLTTFAQVSTYLLVTFVFTLIFKVLPDVKISWRHAFFGGAITGVLFTIGQALIGLYFTRGGVTSAYGAAGALLVALLWIYYSVIIMLFGAEVTKVTAEKAELTAPSAIRTSADRPAGTDPRTPSSNPG
jgi:membrane protein